MPYADSAPETVCLTLLGVWLHDPQQAGEVSARNYPIGADQRDDSLDVLGVPTYYAGREFPVVDYGEHTSQSVGVVIDVPYGSTHLADLRDLEGFAASKRVVYYRDNRGRAMYATLESFRRKDMAWGAQVSFTALRVHWDTEVVSA